MLVEGLVSTIIPVHNRPALLREAVASVLAQTYRPIEIIIVDDGSTDETGREAEALAEKYSEVHSIHRQNGGPGAARETGRLAARGEFTQYLDSDDLLLPTKFELQVAGLR
jgi:glycosyltransferase involved in cell wall biosynthesis